MAVAPARFSHRSKCALGVALFAMGLGSSACARDGVDTRSVTVHAPRACAVDGAAYAEFVPLGDFDGPSQVNGHLLSGVGETLSEIGNGTREILVQATENQRSWRGVGAVPASGAVDVLVLPWLGTCALSGTVDARSGGAMVAMDGGQVLVVGGDGNPTPRSALVDLSTGAVSSLAVGLLRQRTRAGVTAFAGGALVAGGVGDDGTVLSNAEVYDPAIGGFDQARPIDLGQGRADPGAIVLASGDTLLVGGVGEDGRTPLGSLEIVRAADRTVQTEGLARLDVPRAQPTVLRLASGEILVAGGLDETGAPVATLEWLAADASATTKRSRDLVTGVARAFVALDGGGALAVVVPDPSTPAAGFQNVWVVDDDGALEAATAIEGSLTAPVLLGGAGGAPALWTGDRWLRWQPWDGAFGALTLTDEVPAIVGAPAVATDPGLALWLAPDVPALEALRFDLGDEYATLPAPLLTDDASLLAPDRLPAAGVLAFDPASGLLLASGASAFVADRSYADVDVDVDAPTGQPSLVVLRDPSGNELAVGDETCPGVADPGVLHAHVSRRGPVVTWAAGDGAGTCLATVDATARVAVGLRAAPAVGQSVVRNLRVARPSSP